MALAWFVVGSDSGNTDTLTIPVGVDVPRTSPGGGATIIALFYNFANFGGAGISSCSDTASAQDDYSFCVFEDGLNNYGVGADATLPAFGLIVNDLHSGVDTITVGLDSTPDWAQIVAIAVTGVALTNTGLAPLFTSMTHAMATGFFGHSQAPVISPGAPALGLAWDYTTGGFDTSNPHFISPGGATDGDWSWVAGEQAFYPIIADQFFGAGSFIGWTWADGAITDLFQLNETDGGGNGFSLVVGTAPVTPAAAGPSLAGAWTSGATNQGVGNTGIALTSGLGPSCIAPATNFPVFNRHIRLSE